VTPLERRAALRAWRAILPERPGFGDRDLEEALDRLKARLPRSGFLGFRLAVVLSALLEPTFGARDRSRYFVALARHRLLPLRKLAELLKATLILSALEALAALRALGIDA
jgi:hypothetical protein